MATWKRLTDVGKSGLEIDLDTIAFMHSNGNGTQITFDTGQTMTVRESPEAVATPKKPGRKSPPTRHKRHRANFNLHQ